MRFVRFLDRNNQEKNGIVSDEDTVTLIDGTPLNGYSETSTTIPLSDVGRYLPPITPPNIICIGLNYKDHAKESGADLPSAPAIFFKTSNSICGHLDKVMIPKMAPNEIDYEAELGVVIGKKARGIRENQVGEYILGYTVAQDISSRDCQFKFDVQWARAKSFDTFCPLGPYLVTDVDPSGSRIRLELNGEIRQDSSIQELIFPVPAIVSYLSRNFTLLPGTLILTGTPSGVVLGRDPKVWLKPGDKMKVEIENVGVLENEVIAEP